ncbi:MAG: hypothetical protein J1F43_02075 [Muribaculaceae bacterium]|nr:hypothetical protein [Muribaculaceae bacterium]
MDELENMKAMWLELNQRVSALEAENRNLARKVSNEKYKSARDRLIRKYTAFIIVEVIMILYTFAFIGFNPMVVEKYRMVTCFYWLIFFLLGVAVDFYLRQRLVELDIYNSSVREISSQAARSWKIHKLAIIIGFPIAIGAVILFALALDANEFTIYGMIFGALIGATIGFFQLRKFLQYYRLLQTSPSDDI